MFSDTQKKGLAGLLIACLFFFQAPAQTSSNTNDTAGGRRKCKTKCKPNQNVCDSIVLDFRAKTLNIPECVRTGRQLRLKVEHINPALYKIEMDAVDSTVPVPVASALPDFFLKSSNLSDIAESLLSVSGTVPIKGDWSRKLISLTAPQHRVLSKAGIAREVVYSIKDYNPPKKEKECNYLCAVDTLQAGLATAIISLRTEILTARENIDSDVFANLRHLSALLKPDAADPDFKPDVSSLHQRLAGHRVTLRKISDVARQQAEAYDAAMSALSTLDDAPESLEGKQLAADTLIRKFYARAQTELADVRVSIGYLKELELLSRLDSMALLTTTFTSLPMYINGDTKRFSLRITPRSEKTNLPSYSTVFYVPRVRHRVYGVGAGFHIDGLGSHAYVVTTDTASTGNLYQVVEDKKERTSIGLSAQAYTGWLMSRQKAETPVYLGAAFGGGLSLEKKPKPRFMLGGACVVGEAQRIVVSAGAAVGFVTRASPRYLDASGGFKKEPTDYLRDETKVGWYLSLSYSFLGNSSSD